MTPSRWSVDVDCPGCGGPLTPQAFSKPRGLNLRSAATATCPHCRDLFTIVVTLTSEKMRSRA